MSKNTTKKISTIQSDKITSIKVSGAFHKRLVASYFNFAKKFEPSKFDELCNKIGTNSIDSLKDDQDKIDAATIETMLILIKDIEFAFKDAGMISEEEVEIPNED